MQQCSITITMFPSDECFEALADFFTPGHNQVKEDNKTLHTASTFQFGIACTKGRNEISTFVIGPIPSKFSIK